MNHICISAMDECYNPYDSYGEICVGCNCCGRIDKSTMHQCRIETDKRHLVETAQHLTGEDYQTELQQKNILSSIEYFIKNIRESDAAMRTNGNGEERN